MKKVIKFLFSVAVILVVFGASLMVFSACNLSNYEIKTHDIVDEFSGIFINSHTADIAFAKAEDGKTKVVCYEKDKIDFSVAVEDGSLNIKIIDNSLSM